MDQRTFLFSHILLHFCDPTSILHWWHVYVLQGQLALQHNFLSDPFRSRKIKLPPYSARTQRWRWDPWLGRFNWWAPKLGIFGDVSPCFTMFLHVSPCFTMFHHVSPCFTMFHHVSPEKQRVLYVLFQDRVAGLPTTSGQSTAGGAGRGTSKGDGHRGDRMW